MPSQQCWLSHAGRTNLGLGRERGAEEHHRRADDDNALHDIADAVGHRADTRQGVEGKLHHMPSFMGTYLVPHPCA